MRYFFAIIFIAVALLAIATTPSYASAGMVVFKNPGNITNSFLYFGLILGFALFILLMVKYKKLLAFIIYLITFISIYYVLVPFLGLISVIPSILLIVLLAKKPNWIIIDVSAFLLAAGISAIFGISLKPIPVIILLVMLAIYDAISVYKTGHMIDLAESIESIKAPMLFVIPKDDGYAYMGVGDVVMPAILAVSAQYFTKGPEVFSIKLPALSTIIGAFIGLIIVLTLVERKGGAHPGLPFINLGAILGYFIGIALL